MLLTSSFKIFDENIKGKCRDFLLVFILLIMVRWKSLAMSHSTLTSAFFYLVMHSVVGYENAYDLLERRYERFNEPQYFQTKTFYDDRNRFFNRNRNFQQGYYGNPDFRKFDNGYDNLGNGIPVKHFYPFRQQLTGNWQFESRPSRDRTFNNFYFESYPTLRRPHYDHGYYHPRGFHPEIPILSGIYGNRFDTRGKTDFAKIDRFIEDNEDKRHKKTDEYYQRTQEGVNMNSLKKEKEEEHLHADQAGGNKSSLRSNKIVKKGRTTKGFAVHHHKDETGNSTTFFDETSDFGGESDLKDIADQFSTRRTLQQVTDKGDEKHFKENEAQTGNHGTGFLFGNQKLAKDFSSLSRHDESENKFHTGNENDDFGLRSQYLNGGRFDYAEHNLDNPY